MRESLQALARTGTQVQDEFVAAILTSTSALAAPSVSAVFGHVSVTPVLPLAAVAAALWYAHALRVIHRMNLPWPARRTVSFFVGLVLVVWTGCGGLQTYASSVFWIWTTQLLILLLVAPVLVMAGQPVELARESGAVRTVRIVETGPARLLSSPLIGPAVIPVLSALLFFGPAPGWAVEAPWFDWTVQLLVLGIGCLVVLPMLDVREVRVSLVVGLALAIGFVELLLDAIPGIVLRLQTHVSSTFPDHRVLHPWTGSALQDQHTAGTVLWSVAELLDIPFLIVLFVRWSRVDDREARRTDAERDEIETRGGPPTDAPWWLADPQLRDRFQN